MKTVVIRWNGEDTKIRNLRGEKEDVKTGGTIEVTSDRAEELTHLYGRSRVEVVDLGKSSDIPSDPHCSDPAKKAPAVEKEKKTSGRGRKAKVETATVKEEEKGVVEKE